MKHLTGAGASAGLAVVLLVTGAGAAGAAQPVDTWVEEWDDTFTDVCDLGTADPSDDLTIESHLVGTAEFVLREHAPTGEYYITVDVSEMGTYSNVDTGLAWSSLFWTHEKDLRVDVVDDIATVTFGQNFHFRVYAPDGRPGGVQNGRFEAQVVFDLTNDEELSFEELKLTGHGSTLTFCEDALRFTT